MQRSFLPGLRPSLIVGIMIAVMFTAGNIAAEEQRQQPILIPGVQEPEEMRVEPLPKKVVELTAPDRMLGEAIENARKAGTGALLTELNRILQMYPDYAMAYAIHQ
jgi:hypothetical protein